MLASMFPFQSSYEIFGVTHLILNTKTSQYFMESVKLCVCDLNAFMDITGSPTVACRPDCISGILCYRDPWAWRTRDKRKGAFFGEKQENAGDRRWLGRNW